MKNKIEKTKVCVMGLGYVGLPTAAFLAGQGYQVTGVDIRPEIVDTLNSGNIHIHEPELQEKLKEGLKAGKFKASLKPECADIYIITVPTPVNGDHSPDISFVESAVRMIIPCLIPGSMVILESTSPVGTTEAMADIIRRERQDLATPVYTSVRGALPAENRLLICYCPERILPGQMFKEFVDNDRIIGGIDPESADAARAFYHTIVRGSLLVSDCRTAEMAKLSENTFRDVNIALANELLLICEKLGIDAWKLVELANHHPRVNILNPGPGVGGHCIPVDPWFIHHAAPGLAKLIETARNINDSMPGVVADKIIAKCAGIADPKIAILGLSYKPDIDDLRVSPSIEVVRILAERKAGRLLVVEPFIAELPESIASIDGVELIAEPEHAIENSDVVALLVAHWRFHGIPADSLEDKAGRIIDCTGIWKEHVR